MRLAAGPRNPVRIGRPATTRAFTSRAHGLALGMDVDAPAVVERRYRLRVPGGPPRIARLSELVADALARARAGTRGPVWLEALDSEGNVLWHAHHATHASFEQRLLGLVDECEGPPRALQDVPERYSRRP